MKCVKKNTKSRCFYAIGHELYFEEFVNPRRKHALRLLPKNDMQIHFLLTTTLYIFILIHKNIKSM